MARASAAREEAQDETRAPMRSEMRQPMRLQPGEFLGRDGEVLRFAYGRDMGSSEFDVPEECKEPGWSYQWVCETVHNAPNHREMRDMMANGWRPVKPHQLNGYFERYANGEDCIRKDGLILMERPESMTMAARRMDEEKAAAQYGRHLQRADTDAKLPESFKFSRPNMRRSREEIPEDLKPRYKAQVVPAADE